MVVIRGIKKATSLMFYITMAALFAMMCFMTVDVIRQIIRGAGVLGNFEIVQIMMVFVIYFAFGYTQFRGKHIAVDLIISHLPKMIEKIINVFISILCVVVGIVMIMASYTNMIDIWGDKLVSASLRIPLFPFYGIVFFGCIVLAIAFAITAIERVCALVPGKGDLFKDLSVEESP